MAIRLEPKSPFIPGTAIAPFSSKDVDPSKLGFTPETLGQRLPFGKGIDRYISFENLCNHILSILYDQWIMHGKTIVLCRTNSMLMFDCLDCGLPMGETYHKTTPENKKLSWVHQILEALQKNRFILSFQTDEGHIWVEKSEGVSRLIPGDFFRNPEPISPFCENPDVQKSDVPSLPSGKGKDIPLSPPRYLKNIDPSKLGFTRETLDQNLSLGNDRCIRFETLCEILLPVICKQFCVFENTIFLDETNEEFILKSLDYGLPNGETYHKTTPQNKKQSWIYQILEALQNNNYILSFEISEKYIRIEKSKRTPEVIPVPFLTNPMPIRRVPEVNPAFSYPAPTDALPSFAYLNTSKLDFTPKTFELIHDLGASASPRMIPFKNLCDRILLIVRTAFEWRRNRDNNILLLDGSNYDNFSDVLDCGLPTGENYHKATPEIQKQSWVYEIFQSLQRTRYIKSFAIENKGKTRIRIVIEEDVF